MGKWNGFGFDTSKHNGFTPYYDQPLPYDLTPAGNAALDEDEDDDGQ
jgi:hypothetical protein